MVNDDRMGGSEKNMIIMYYGANYKTVLNYIRTLLHVLNVHFLASYNYRIVGTGSTRRRVVAYTISC